MNTMNQVRPAWHTAKSVFDGLKQISTLFAAKPKANVNFKVRRYGDRVIVESTHRNQAHGCVEIRSDSVHQVFATALGQSLKEGSFPNMNGASLRLWVKGSGMSAILIRREFGLQLEMVHGGNGYINFGQDKCEMQHLLSFLATKQDVLSMFAEMEKEVKTPTARQVALYAIHETPKNVHAPVTTYSTPQVTQGQFELAA